MSNRNIPEEIKAQLTIEQVVGSYLPLKKAGRIYKANCPFHGEKTPSFTVSPDRGIFKCFGCGEAGDIFDFVMKIEGLNFPEAIRLLGERAGVQLEEWQPNQQQDQGPSKTKLIELNTYVAKLWHAVLTKHPKAEGARTYLTKRGLLPPTIDLFQVGYAPFGNATADGLRKGQFSREIIQAAGDPTKFQDRITFPICDLTGKIVGFTGRLLELPDDPRSSASRGPKYWNTPETAAFIKSRTVYALHLAKHAIQDQGLAILTEGQMDVIMLHQAGYTHAVASSGTALTAEQLKLLKRFAPSIVFAYDQDKAGIDATKRGIELALENELNTYVITVPNGKDPADCLLKEPESWHQAYENRKPYMDWIIDDLYLAHEKRPLSSERKKVLAKELLNWVAKVQDITEQADWLRKLSAKLETSEANLRELFRRLHPEKPVSSSREEERTITPDSASNLAEIALAILLTYPEVLPTIRQQLSTFLIGSPSPLLQKIVPVIESTPPELSLDQHLNQALTDEERKAIAIKSEELLLPYDGVEVSATWAATELTQLLQRIRSASREQSKTRIAQAIKDAQELGDTAKLKELLVELQKLV